MKISNQSAQSANLSGIAAKAKTDGVDKDVLSVFMDNDKVNISQQKIDPNTPSREWNIPMAEPRFQDLLKSNGLKSKGSEPVEITIIHTNDEHDNNFSKLPLEATLLRSREKFHGDENSFMVNTGDVSYDGSNDEPGPQFFGPVADAFNSIGMEIFVPGNHEFQHGGKYLEEEFLPMLNSTNLLGNVTFKSGGKPLDHTKPYVVEEMNGVKVGFIGLTTPRQATSAHPKVGFDVNVQSLKSAASNLVSKAKADGADIIVILAHESVGKVKELASSVKGIDVIVAGHDHKTLEEPETVKNPDGRNTLVVEAASNCRYVGDMNLQIDSNSKEILGVSYKLFSTDDVTPDPEVSKIIENYKSHN